MTKKGRLTGYHVLFILLGFFGIMFAVNILFTVMAVKTFPGEQEEKSYLQGINFNETLKNKAHQDELGWRSEIGFLTETDNTPLLVTNWFDNQDGPLTALKVHAQLTRPASDEGQLQLVLSPNGPGRYEAQLSSLEAGTWNVELTAVSPDGETVKAHKTLTWQH